MLNAELEVVAIDAVTISDHETRRFVIRKGVNNLLTCPASCRMGCDVEVHDSSSVMLEDDETIQQLETNGRHDEEVDGRDITDVVFQERSPGLRRWLAMPAHVFRHCRLVHRVT